MHPLDTSLQISPTMPCIDFIPCVSKPFSVHPCFFYHSFGQPNRHVPSLSLLHNLLETTFLLFNFWECNWFFLCSPCWGWYTWLRISWLDSLSSYSPPSCCPSSLAYIGRTCGFIGDTWSISWLFPSQDSSPCAHGYLERVGYLLQCILVLQIGNFFLEPLYLSLELIILCRNEIITWLYNNFLKISFITSG